ncbi:MAG TPA: choice-of-anchor D domain-containing protein [Terriglobia bacterium]|nr:choice-of-anchor D domain-containing protein [Terriglobia bacterium]
MKEPETRDSGRSVPRGLTLALAVALAGLLAAAPAAWATNPVPLISQLSPPSAAPGGAEFTLIVDGAGFQADSVVEWNGTELFTIINSSDELMATVPASLIATAGTAAVTAVNPGATTSNVAFFPIASSEATAGFGLTDLTGLNIPNAIATGDFNNDGIPDLAVTVNGGNGINIFLGNGNGTFRAPIFTSAFGEFGVLGLGDFNGDGKLDVITSNGPGTLAVYLGNGDGTLTLKDTLSVSFVQPVFTGDFNGDGKLDFVTLSNQGFLETYLGNGDGTFQNPISNTTGQSFGGIAVGDFNDDGKLDLAVGSSGQLSILLGNGDGTFQNAVGYAVPNGALTLVTADFNGDGKLDIAATNPFLSNTVSVLLGNGDGSFQAAASYATNTAPTSLAVADLNNDGKPDLLIVDNGDFFGFSGLPSFVSLLLGNGDGTFQAHVDFPVELNPAGLAVADFNNDGRLDAAVANASSNTVSILLQGGVALSPTTLTFLAQNVGSTSTSQTLTLFNSATSALTISSITFTGADGADFGQTNTCGGSLAAGASCTLAVTFTPTATGTRTATLNLNDSGQFSPQTVSLTGTATQPTVTLVPNSLTFPLQLVGTLSGGQGVTLTNTGTGTLTITSITASAGFITTNNCGGSVAVGGACTVTAQFDPVTGGVQAGSVSIADNAPGSPQSVSLTGTGTTVELSAIGVNFGDQAVGTGSTPVAVTLTNKGTGPLTINSISLTGADPGDFGESNTCGSSVGAGASCTITLTFTPTTTGMRSAAVTISDSDLTSPQTIGLSGNGVISGPSAVLSPASLTFAKRYDGNTSPPQSVTLTNNGSATLTITSIVPSGDFAETNTCGSSVLPNTSCAINVTFTPTQVGTRTGTITITDNAPGSPQSVSLSGTGGAALALGLTLDFDSDAGTDYTVWRPSNGTWYVLPSNGGASIKTQWGMKRDIVAPGDYDGDGITDVAVWRPSNGTFYVILSSTGKSVSQQWGATGDIPVPGDYDGDDKTDYAVWRPSNGTWYVVDSSTGKSTSFAWGAKGDIPVPGDYDGDGKTDYAVWRPSNGTFYVVLSSTGKSTSFAWGASTDKPVPGDYDGDGKTDYAVWRPSNGTFYVVLSSTGETTSRQWGASTDVPVPRDYDGDGKTDYAVWRPSNGTWYVVDSSTGLTTSTAWGASTDVPVNKPTGQ